MAPLGSRVSRRRRGRIERTVSPLPRYTPASNETLGNQVATVAEIAGDKSPLFCGRSFIHELKLVAIQL